MQLTRRSVGFLLLLLAAALLVIEAVSVLARFAVLTGASEVVPVSRWQTGDALRLVGAVVLAVVAAWLLRRSGPG
jgi:hypothetical protein